MRTLTWLAALVALDLAALHAADLPRALRAETSRLIFQAAPLSSNGTLQEQVRAALDPFSKSGSRLVKVRAFVLGDGAGVTAALADAFARKRWAPPVVNVIRVGALPTPGAQVALELTAVSPKTENPNGVVFISGQMTSAPRQPGQGHGPVEPLARKSVASLKSALAGMGLQSADALRVTCFASSLEDGPKVRQLLETEFPHAALNVMQAERDAAADEIECEAVARLAARIEEPARLVNPTRAAFAQAAMFGAREIIFTSTEAGAGAEGAREAFEKINRALASAGASLNGVYYAYAYPSSQDALQRYRDQRWEFLNRAHAPASTNLVFEGVPGSATIGIDVIALAGK
jgi:enamine deaminase RidA (YjgF/YER057c/UK114 family)